MIEPLRHNPQTQPITVTLKNICRDYPAGGGVLRELLQNADDAGASSVRFVLDQTNYPAVKLVDTELAEHQGPSLLAYNDAIFSERDFGSLSRIGDSGKLLDGSTTGRFGRGFNAVYNWTDSPSIVSGNSLLILDPHHRWTGRFPNPGGPIYDFVENAAGGAMKDQMAAFSSVTKDFDQAFQGTIIRIPLRTPAQALESKICSRAATFSEVAQVLETFADDFGHTGLLFMKNVSRISITVGDKPPRNIYISNIDEVKRNKSEINTVIKKTIREGDSKFNCSFQVEIMSGLSGKEQMYRFAIHHSIQNYPGDESLKSWSRDEALVPWVAVASEIDACAGEKIGGSLFNVLPSQIRINQPIHIHSCFSMSPDRARLHRIGDSSVQYPLSGRWNHWLFDELIPAAWADLLVYLAQQYPDKPAFTIWPRTQGDSNDISYRTNEKVLQIIQQKNYRVWYTDLGYVTMNSGLVSKGDGSLVLRKALNEAGVPVIYLPDFLFSSAEKTCKVEHLKPQTLCARLGREQKELRRVSVNGKQALLDYVISDSSFRGYGAVELFPFEDGTYRAINNEIAFIHRDEDERLLFQREKARNIDIQKLSSSALQIFRKGCNTASLHTSLRQRSSQDLKTYCLKTHFDKIDVNEDLMSVDGETSTFISKVWDWIETRQYSILDNSISCLWLLPLTNGRYRKIKPTQAHSNTICATTGELGNFLSRFAKIAATSNKPIVNADKLSSRTLKLITDAMKKDPNLLVGSSDSVEDFILWLGKTREVFDLVTDDDKWLLHKLLASRMHACQHSSAVSITLKSLKIFQKTVWRPKNDIMVLRQTWISLEGYNKLVGLREISPVPDIGDVIFLDAKNDETMRVLSYFRLAECPSSLELLERFIIPFWDDEKMLRIWTSSGKEKLTESILRDYYRLNSDSRRKVSASAMVPVKRFDGEKAVKFSVAKSLINPAEKELRELYFEDEEACPVDWILEKYDGVLINCGLRTSLDSDHVVERAKCFAQRSSEIQDTLKRARKLLQSSPSWKEISNDHQMSTLRELRWLPVTDLDGSCTFKNAKECRGLDEKSLVGYVLPVLGFEISLDWRKRLGWSHLIPCDTLLVQLECGIKNRDRKVTDAVLNYVDKKRQVDSVRQALMKLSCVVATKGQFVSVEKTFQSGCEGLQPYLHDVDWRFWEEHELLLKKLGVKAKPEAKDLIKIQDQFSSDALHDKDIPIAIQVIKLASAFPRSQLSSLKILDGTGRLRPMKDVTYNDLGSSTITGTFHSTHPDISKTIVKTLQIEPLSVRVRKHNLGIADEDDDEFDQHEDVATGISDTLTRYTVESTFKEFLANADDCNKAKEVNWLLDNRVHPKDHLLTDELGMLQGPALLVHNDGVFDDDDFEGLRRVGRGSKMDDATTIGKFGRGSQTMYHWSDVPMLLSGKYLVILDPLRQVLDMNYRTRRRKPGVKIELSKLKGQFRDQLAPFEGLWGFSQELEYYNGTIFRFPLRQPKARSKLLETGKPLDFSATRKCLDDFLEEEGRVSLLFLRNIQYMDFKIHGDSKPRWSVKSDKSDKDWSFSGWTKCTITRCMLNHGSNGTVTERWRVAIEDLKNVCTELPSRHRRRMKNVECGMAAFVPVSEPSQDRVFKSAPVPKYFSTLPLPFPTDLPVHIHATFLLASDRASISIEDSTQEDGAKWNRWLLSHAIPDLYLAFLEDLGRQSNWVHDPFLFWPQDSPSKRHLYESVYTSFWQMLPKSPRGLFPVTRQIKAAQLGERRPPELVNAEEAIFDFLSTSESVALRKVLESQIPNLVRPPRGVRRELQRGMDAKSVTPKRLRQIFKGETASKFLEEETSKDRAALKTILKLIKPTSDEDFKELDGCRILLLADGTLGILRFKNLFNLGENYLLVDVKELKLFEFASSRLISQEDVPDFMTAIMDCEKFNITRLDLSNIGTLLERKEFGDHVPTAERDIWLAEFWIYCLGREASQAKTSQAETYTPFTSSFHIGCYPIFKATCDDIERYVEPNKINMLPSVIEPDNPQEKSLCSKFPGIYVFSSKYLPTYLRTTETSLCAAASFVRFITTISKLAGNTAMDVYIKRHLGTAEISLLRRLVKKFVSADHLIENQNIKSILRSLPLWPNAKSSTWISATSAFATANSQLLVPWMTEYHNFIECKTTSTSLTVLKALDVKLVSDTELLLKHILPNWPAELPDINNYMALIRAIPRISDWRTALGRLRQSRLAPNRAKQLQTASQLFDHNDTIFKAAFRDEAAVMFLLEDLEESRSFWLELGLKHRVNEQFEPEDYVRCLKKMRDRLESCTDQALYPTIVSDARLVLGPLTSPSTALARCSKRDWTVIANQATFPVLKRFNDQEPHRREAMLLVATATPLLQLSEIIRSQYIAICWSQTSFPIPSLEPTITTIAEINSKGKPSTNMVWRHVEHMASSVGSVDQDGVAAFLSDLYKSYDYLQENLDDSRASFSVLQEHHVWFNLEPTDTKLVRKSDLEASRCSIKNLILESSCDTANLKSVRQGLIRYQGLLRALGCKSIVYPLVEEPEKRTKELVSTSLSRLRREGKLLDVTLEAESGSIKAHRVVIAAASTYFATQFNGNWSNNETIPLKQYSHRILSTVVDFSYSDADQYDWTSMQLQDDDRENLAVIADRLDDWLELLEAADYLGMPDLEAQVEGQILFLAKVFIREHNVLDVLRRASDAHATLVMRYCSKFYAENKRAVDLAVEE